MKHGYEITIINRSTGDTLGGNWLFAGDDNLFYYAYRKDEKRIKAFERSKFSAKEVHTHVIDVSFISQPEEKQCREFHQSFYRNALLWRRKFRILRSDNELLESAFRMKNHDSLSAATYKNEGRKLGCSW